jgi:hypothetical protein
LLNIRDPGEDEGFIGPDGKQIHYLKGSVGHPGLLIYKDVSMLEDTLTLPFLHPSPMTTPAISYHLNDEEWCCLDPLLAGDINQINHFLLTLLGYQWMTFFENTSLPPPDTSTQF